MAVTGYGFKPIQLLGGKAFSGGTIREFVVTPAAATNPICTGDIVNVQAGVALAAAAAPAAGTLSANSPIGISCGVRFTDPVLKQTQHAQFLPANSTGYTNIYVKTIDDPDLLMQIRYDGAITSTSIGFNAAITWVAGSTTTGNSKYYASGAASTNTLPLRIVDVLTGGTDPVTGTAFTEIIVKWNWTTHQYHFALGQ